jgi:hypothetical protein
MSPFSRKKVYGGEIEEMRPRLTAGKTVVKGGLELPQFVHEAFHITGDEVKGGNGKSIPIGPAGW